MNQTATKNDCPDADVLAKYVSGSLVEARADRLLSHMEGCENCQRTIDEMARRADSLVSAMRRPVATPSPRDSQELDRLIAAVQRPQPTNTAPLAAEGKIDPVPLEQFLACLSKSGLSDGEQISSWVKEYSPDSSLTFANTLVDQGALTPLQARALLRGRWRGLVLGNYVVLEKLGQGGMGQVFRARHRQMHRDVCVKVLHPKGQRSPEHIERFRREARAVATLDHPNIVVAHDADEADNIHYLVMELVEGSDLAKLVATKGPLLTDVAVRYITQAATALAYAHARGVIHRDIKPHNLFLEDSGGIKILDLGLARIDAIFQPEGEPAYSTMTKTGMVVGTVDYIAPEQAVNARDADYRSDIYSLGCTLHFLLTGRAVYPGETLMARLVAHREEPIPSLMNSRGDVSPRLDAIFQKMIAKHPSDRYQSMTELVRDLQALQRGEQPAAVAQPPIQHPIPLEPVEEDETLANFDAPTLDMSLPVSLPRPAIPAGRRKARDIPQPLLLWSGVAAAALAGIVLLFVVASSYLSTMPAWGGPRAVVVVAPDKFNSSHYRAVTKALTDRNIPFVVASTKSGEAQGDDGSKVGIDFTISDYTPRSSDGVIVCGGHVEPLKKTDLVDKSLERGAVVLGISGDGFAPLHAQYHQAKKKLGKEWDPRLPGGVTIRAGKGFITKACDVSAVPKMVDVVFTDLVAK